jgi:hypothetical protein
MTATEKPGDRKTGREKGRSNKRKCEALVWKEFALDRTLPQTAAFFESVIK